MQEVAAAFCAPLPTNDDLSFVVDLRNLRLLFWHFDQQELKPQSSLPSKRPSHPPFAVLSPTPAFFATPLQRPPALDLSLHLLLSTVSSFHARFIERELAVVTPIGSDRVGRPFTLPSAGSQARRRLAKLNH